MRNKILVSVVLVALLSIGAVLLFVLGGGKKPISSNNVTLTDDGIVASTSVAKENKVEAVTNPRTDSATADATVSASETVGTNCIQNDKYIAVSVQEDVRQYPNAYVYLKKDGATCQRHDAIPIFTMDMEVTYLEYLLGDFLITDTGTGPSGRVLSAYNIVTKEQVFSEGYGGITSIHGESEISYWRSTKVVPLNTNCPDIEEIEKNYLTPEVQELVTRNLASGDLAVTKTRCVATQ